MSTVTAHNCTAVLGNDGVGQGASRNADIHDDQSTVIGELLSTLTDTVISRNQRAKQFLTCGAPLRRQLL